MLMQKNILILVYQTIYSYLSIISKQNMTNISLNFIKPDEDQRQVTKFKEKAAALFDKLNSLQQVSEGNKSMAQRSKMVQQNQKENKVFQTMKAKEERYSKILQTVNNIQKDVEDMRNQEERCTRAIKTWIEGAERQLQSSFDALQKERIKNQASLEQFVESKLQSFILKNKNVWNEGSLIKPEPYIEQIQHATKQHKKFLEQIGKEAEKLRKDTYNSIKECTRLAQEEACKNQEQQITGFMRMVHMDISAKFKGLRDQRQRTEERVINVLERVVASCIPKSVS